ncbi:hypothetical protein KC992_04125, partial [Candidatus Saccharibacteria bacterium]|nr:hypothetical protein [Candidatus Saccharibacteria bacterium]
MKYLRYIAALFLLVVSFGFTPEKAAAVSNDILIYQLQAGPTNLASDELVILYNSSASDVEVTDWCLQYSSSSSVNVLTNDVDFSTFACIEPPAAGVELWLPAGGLVSFATTQFIATQNAALSLMGATSTFQTDFVFSARFAQSGRHVRLIDASADEV